MAFALPQRGVSSSGLRPMESDSAGDAGATWEVVAVPTAPERAWYRLATRLHNLIRLRSFWGQLGRLLRERGEAGKLR